MGESSRAAPHGLTLPAPARTVGRGVRISLDRWFTPFAVLPTFAVMLLVFGLPLLFSLYLSFTGWSLSQELLGGEFVGLAIIRTCWTTRCSSAALASPSASPPRQWRRSSDLGWSSRCC
ncbi:hypothetical protein ACFQU2_04555 [Siccirubricoccus deserti]